MKCIQNGSDFARQEFNIRAADWHQNSLARLFSLWVRGKWLWRNEVQQIMTQGRLQQANTVNQKQWEYTNYSYFGGQSKWMQHWFGGWRFKRRGRQSVVHPPDLCDLWFACENVCLCLNSACGFNFQPSTFSTACWDVQPSGGVEGAPRLSVTFENIASFI